jgi:4-amino-4-deoxy-L-arabinose transferase-like glycosyltransferase
MTTPPATQPPRREETIILAPSSGVTAVWVQVSLAILAALGLRFLFALRYPGSADDSDLYIQLARTWADHHVYGFPLNGQIIPTDLRTPGYPAFLAGVALLLGRSMRAILLSQAVLDCVTCILTAGLASALAPVGWRRRVAIIALWLAATCPFLANYSAVVLTEVLVTFLATAALWCFAVGLRDTSAGVGLRDERSRLTPFAWALLGAFLTGVATLVRPEMPLLFCVAAAVYAVREWKILGLRRVVLFASAMGGALLLPLLPWAARNWITLREVQFLSPRYVNLPGETAPGGYYSWTSTWLERYRDVYYTVWQLGVGPQDVDDLPASAFDSSQEKERVAALLAQVNDGPDYEVSPEVDEQFAQIARERTRRHPLRTYVEAPFQRALTIWFTPRTELMDIDGKFWPLRQQWRDSRANVLITGSFAVLGYAYVALAIVGVWLVWSAGAGSGSAGTRAGPNLWGIALLLGYLFVRTAFLTTVEAPEPRYVVSCYPEVLALIALLGSASWRRRPACPEV